MFTVSDHFIPSTVRTLAMLRPTLRWACCPWMVTKLVAAGVKFGVIDVFNPGQSAWYRGIGTVRPEEIPHNVQNCCWTVETDAGETALYATDCGSLEKISAVGYDLYLVEENHTRAELEARAAEKQAAGEFAYEFTAAANHLSREQAIDWLVQNMGPTSVWVPMHGHKNRERRENNERNDASGSCNI